MNNYETIAADFSLIANLVEDYTYSAANNFSRDERTSLRTCIKALRDQADQMQTEAANGLMGSIEKEAANLRVATATAKQAVANINGIKMAITLLTGFIEAATAIVTAAQTGDLSAVADAGKKIYEVIKDAQKA